MRRVTSNTLVTGAFWAVFVGIILIGAAHLVFGVQWFNRPTDVKFIVSSSGEKLQWTQTSDAVMANVLFFTKYQDTQCQLGNIASSLSSTPTQAKDCTKYERHILGSVSTEKGGTASVIIPGALYGQPLYIEELNQDGSLYERLFGGKVSGPYQR